MTRVRQYALALLVMGLAVRLVPAYFVYGSFDVGAWVLVVHWYRYGRNPYMTGKLNWPPLWPMLLLYSLKLEDVYNLPLHFAVKIIPCIADALIGVALFVWFARTVASPAAAFRRSLWYVLNPVAIATCALHGQFESLPSLFTLLALLEASRNQASVRTGHSAFWLSMAAFAKTWPLLLLPAFLQNMSTLKHRCKYVAIALAPAVIGVLAVYAMAPRAVAQYVICYRSNAGYWGLTSFNYLLPIGTARVWSQIVLAMLGVACFTVYRIAWRRTTPVQMAVLGILTFYVFTPGWGAQYLAWILAPAILSDFQRVRVFTLATTICLAIMYIFAPFNGEYYNFLNHNHTKFYWATYLAAPAFRGNALLFLPLWLVCLAWWLATLREILQKPVSDQVLPVHSTTR